MDNVYLTPGTDLAVFERGGMLRQLRGDTERCLILGVGVLDGLELGPFKAILAHEYGHFSNQDTAGGGFALAVRRSIITMAHHLAERRAATWYNPAWWFVNGFHRVFLRISQGASRLQEVLADRWAAFTYGAAAFERGLRHVIERSIFFQAHADAVVQDAVRSRFPLTNLYQFDPAELAGKTDLSQEIAAALRRQPTPYDSHPAPLDRFAWAHAIAGSTDGAAENGTEVSVPVSGPRRDRGHDDPHRLLQPRAAGGGVLTAERGKRRLRRRRLRPCKMRGRTLAELSDGQSWSISLS